MKHLSPEKTGILQIHPAYRQPMRDTAILVALLALVAFLSLPLSVMSGMRGIAGYLPLHILFETIAVVVSMLIFAVGWHAHHRKLPGNIVLLACAFFGVGLLDFAHMLSYSGMPDFVTPGSPEKAINFWLVARSLSAIALLAVALMPWRPFASATTRYVLFAAVLAATALAYWLILFHQDEMPNTYIPGKGLTPFKIASEYLLILLNLATAFLLLKQMRKPQPFDVTALFGALCVMALSEFFFAIYANITDVFNFLGHVYKTIAYLLLYRAFFVATVEAPYRQLQSSETRLRTLFESTSDAVMLVGEEGFLDCNKAALAMFGCRTKEDFCLMRPADISPPTQPGGGDSRMLAERNNAAAMEEGRHFFEWVCKRVDNGNTFIANVLLSRMELDGRMVLQATVRDITARKNSEARIERLSRAYRLLSQVNETIVRAQKEQELFAAICNSAAESGLFRLAWVGVLDENRTCVIPVASAGVEEGYTARLNIRMDDERTGNGPIGRSIRDGTPVVCQDIENDPSMVPWREEAMKRGYRASAAFPVREAGEVTGTINVYAVNAHFFTSDIMQLMLELAADVSFALDAFAEKKRREQAEDEIRHLNVELEHRVVERTRQLEAVNKELESFSYSVSHDLRAPLRSIDGFSRVLATKYHEQLDATGQDWLERVCHASQHMGDLIEDILTLSQVARSPLRREPVDLSKIAEEVADALGKAHPERQVRFTLQQGLIIHTDTGLMRVVMDNLLGNAWKYTGKKIEAEVEFGTCDINGESVYFVRDNGAGFNMDYADKLFGAFQRLHGNDEFEGTGIGLATVQRIINRHNGKVWAEAIEGQGATFYFTLPQKTQEHEDGK